MSAGLDLKRIVETKPLDRVGWIITVLSHGLTAVVELLGSESEVLDCDCPWSLHVCVTVEETTWKRSNNLLAMTFFRISVPI